MDAAAFSHLLGRLSTNDLKFLDNCVNAEQLAKNTDSELPLGDSGHLFYCATGEYAQFGTGGDTYIYVEGLIGKAIDLGLIRTETPRKPDPASHDHFLTALGLDFLKTWHQQKQAGASA